MTEKEEKDPLFRIKKTPTERFGLLHEFSIGHPYDTQNNTAQTKYYHRGFTECNFEVLRQHIQPWMKLIVEIGIAFHGWDESSSKVIIENRPDDCFYYGIEKRKEVKRFEKQYENMFINITDSRNVEENLKDILTHGEYIDMLVIDGFHSVDVVSREWDYAPYVRPNGGVIILHDTRCHPGPWCLMESVDPDVFDIARYCEADDNGIGVLIRK